MSRKASTREPRFQIVVILATLLFALAAGDVQAASGSKIVFASDRDGDFEIYVMDADGSNQTRLTFSPGSDRFPAWSPDGRQIVFSSERDGNPEIYVMEANGSNPIRLTFAKGHDVRPAWSPDGSKIVFDSNRGGHSEIYVMESSGSNQTRLTFGGRWDWAHYARWSPDGSQILFCNGFDSSREIWVMAPDGSNQTRLTYTAYAANSTPDWSPGGSKIAFTTQRHGRYNGQLYVMDADGSNQARLTNNPHWDSLPTWSEDGSQIAFVRKLDFFSGDDDIYVMSADGSEQTPLTINDANDVDPCWLHRPSFRTTFNIDSLIVTFPSASNLNRSDNLSLAGQLVLDAESDDIDLLSEDVVASVGTVALTIPAGSFAVDGSRYFYAGIIDGAQVQAVFEDLGVDEWRFGIEVSSVDAEGTANPVTCSLAIGNDWGETTERLGGQLRKGDGVVVEGSE